MFEYSSEVTEDEFLGTYDALEARASVTFIESAAVLRPAVKGDTDAGALVGKNANGTIEGSFWATERVGQERASGTDEGTVSKSRGVAYRELGAMDGNDSGWAPDKLPKKNPDLYFCDTDGRRSMVNLAYF